MKKATENQGTTRTSGEYFSPRSKMMDLVCQQHCPPYSTSSNQETPMKPSQVPNRLSIPPPRRVLPIKRRKPCHTDRSGPPRESLHTQRLSCSPEFSLDSHTNIGTPTQMLHYSPRDTRGSTHSFTFCSSQHSPVNQSHIDTSAKMPQHSPAGVNHCVSPQLMKDHTPSFHIRGYQVQGPMNTLSYPDKTATSQESEKAQSNIVRSPISTIELHRPPVTTSLNTSSAQEDLICSSKKRHREFEPSDKNEKTSLVWPSRQTSALERPLKSKESHLGLEPACGQSTSSDLSSTFKPAQSFRHHCPSKPCIQRQPSVGAKQAYVHKSTHDQILKIKESYSNPVEDSLKKVSEERNKSSTPLSPEDSQCDASGHVHHSTPVVPLKTLSKGTKVEEKRKTDSSTPKSAIKQNLGPLSCHKTHQEKKRPRRPAIPNDVDELFTPDPMTYVVNPVHKSAKSKTDGGMIKSPTSEKDCSSSTATSSNTPVTGSCRKTHNSKVTDFPHPVFPHVAMPSVTLERVKLENVKLTCSEHRELKNRPVTSSGRLLKEDGDKSDKHVSHLSKKASLKTDAGASDHTSKSHCSHSPSRGMQTSEEGRKQVNEEDSIDMELDLGLSLALDFDLTQSSQSSEEEQLLSLQEMMERVTKPPGTPEKGAFSEPSTPGQHSRHLKTQPLATTTKPGLYKNNLDQMLKEINTNKKAKEIETQLLTACKEDLLRIAQYEEAEENQEEGISTEQQEFLQRYSLMSNAIREVPPGEVVFNLEKFGRLFSQDTLQLRQCIVHPQGTAQKTLLWSSPAQLRLHLNIGLFQEAYDCYSPCPTQVTRFLFKMMSVHNERMVSDKILQALCDIACTAAFQIVKNGSKQFKVWVPSLADVTLVLMNMGIAFVTLFPFQDLQPPFTEGDLLEDIYIKSDSPSNNKEQSTFPEHNCNNFLKYLAYCMGLCPRAYSDDELLLLLTVIGRMALDIRLILQSSVELYPLLYKLVNNIRDWNTMLPRICLALTNLTDDHHNMCLLVQLLPDNTRGKQLRRHLSLSMISKLLDGSCTYRPTEEEFQLSNLRPYLHCMQPSTLLRAMLRSQKDKEEDMGTLDQQSYYLCYSLLTLTNEASNFQFFPAHQKEQLLCLCSELETYVKCDIRESEKCLYRSKVKDLVARIYTKWQMLLQRTRPLHGKLYDYWQPRPGDTLISSQEEGKMDTSDDEGSIVMKDFPVEEEEQDKDANEVEENEVFSTAAVEEEEKIQEEMKAQDIKLDEEQEAGGEYPVDDKNQTDEAIDPEGVNLL
ncbi:SMC5-SMC6 complex localization factor protein 2 isoform X3 [Echeneis naucrates]|uniref:SMC5-SMC6 complex localization factor protein 2 isoform X3 n=1 Tax=Echeneis naucrates TaxID=173247 RepID=UPI00111349C0|nr:SMC5-SMC6 complex localization factor protein 2-like isoform X3 [Echeneis naucrates]